MCDACAGARTIIMKGATADYLAKNDPRALRGIILSNEKCPEAPEAK